MLDVSIIIVNYNSWKLLQNCINSIIKLTHKCSYEIIVVDNNSEEDCSDIIGLYSENINYIRLTENIGFGRANNVGIEIANGRHILFLNPDTILMNDAISIMSNYLDENSEVGSVGGNLFDINLEPTRSFRRRFPDNIWLIDCILLANAGERIIYHNSLYFNFTKNELQVAYIVGADLMVKKSILDNIGGFNSCFFMYYEEIELCFRITNAGYSIVNLPTAHIQHLEGKSTNNIQFKAEEMAKSINNYFKLTNNSLKYKIFRILYGLLAIERYLISKILKRMNNTYWKIQLLSIVKH